MCLPIAMQALQSADLIAIVPLPLRNVSILLVAQTIAQTFA
jgi:hypothetical protein